LTIGGLEVMAHIPPKTNAEIREWYLDEVATTPKLNRQWIKDGFSLDVRARMAWKFRHDKRLEARALMADKSEVELLRQRDIKIYRSPNGPTFRFLFNRLSDEGLSENEVYEAIIKGSYRTNAGVNKSLGF
jgi:hypothetical protein